MVALNRAMAVAQANGAAAALPLVEALQEARQLQAYAPLHAVHGELLQRLGRKDEAREAFARAVALATNLREREALMARIQ